MGKLSELRKKMDDMKQRGLEKSLQLQDERKRKKKKKLENMKPGTRRTIAEGIALKKSPLDVMKEEYSRRKYERESRYHNKDEDDSG